ncbi:MAG: hypothetical protein L0K46_05135 [Yaniella sp.]|uniref:hypothetical protein n=1 Tax=Yaniella sp. TaxID=2773929 RepID=UPI002648231B|nr:hypothetical protein [Yaniella sp.]MDN5732117.1 hypothetical protein [Yaniella sp.]MDN5912731.1 hypothetical protein [Yaniella sp.]MDN6457264.1 hypothetical protein [Yaniella sp.]MDN6520348.1 hypothetical protein [Yaniella sp.]
MLLASAILGIFSLVLTTEQFHAWGWRVPFLVSFVLIFVGYYIRRKVAEPPVFQELRDNAAQSKTPLRQLFQDDWKTIIKAALAFAGNNAAGYMVAGGFVLGYVTTTHVVTETHMLILVAADAALWIVTTLFGGIISDRYWSTSVLPDWLWLPAGLGDPHVFDDRPPQYVAHYLLGARLHDPNWTVLRTAIGNVFRNVPIAHPLSGFSISYAIGAILGGAFAPTIAQYLVGTTGWIGSVGVYLGIMATISGVAILTIEEPRGTPLSPEQEQSQEKSEPVSTPEAQKAGAL